MRFLIEKQGPDEAPQGSCLNGGGRVQSCGEGCSCCGTANAAHAAEAAKGQDDDKADSGRSHQNQTSREI